MTPGSLREKFARVASATAGVALMLSVPVYAEVTKDPVSPAAFASTMALGFFMIGSLAHKPRASVKDAFTKTKMVIPSLALGGFFMVMATLTANDASSRIEQYEEDLKTATLLNPDEMVSERAQDRYCVKRDTPYNQIVTLDGQKRFIPCP